jgi:hypothetical protein
MVGNGGRYHLLQNIIVGALPFYAAVFLAQQPATQPVFVQFYSHHYTEVAGTSFQRIFHCYTSNR